MGAELTRDLRRLEEAAAAVVLALRREVMTTEHTQRAYVEHCPPVRNCSSYGTPNFLRLSTRPH